MQRKGIHYPFDVPRKGIHYISNLDVLDYGVGDWNPDRGLGYHRVVIKVEHRASAVFVHIPWRRRDPDVETKGFLLYRGIGWIRKQITNIFVVTLKHDFADIIFEPRWGAGTFALYYLPTKRTGKAWYFPEFTYLSPGQHASPRWLAKNGLDVGMKRAIDPNQFPKAIAVRIEAANEFHSFFPMEVNATADEIEDLKSANPDKQFLLFPESREHPIRMIHPLPYRWKQSRSKNDFHDTAARGEYFTFQVGVWAMRSGLDGIAIDFRDLQLESGTSISKDKFTCLNLGGVDWLGKPFTKDLSIKQATIQALWIGLDVPVQASPGQYKSTMTLRTRNAGSQDIVITIDVADKEILDRGYGDLWRHARMNWLNSTTGIDDDVVKPFTPVLVNEKSVRVLGRALEIGEYGLPERIVSTFTSNNDSFGGPAKDILASQMRFSIWREGEPITFKASGIQFTKKTNGCAEWETTCTAPGITMRVAARMECDGHVDYSVAVTALDRVDLDDARLEVPFKTEIAQFMMGLGVPGGNRPHEHAWKWQMDKANASTWIGTVNAGLLVKLNHATPDWPMYNFKATGLYRDWDNNGAGGCELKETGDNVVVLSAFTGRRAMEPGEQLALNFALLITPIKVLDKNHWSWRYYHKSLGLISRGTKPWIKTAAKNGATIINVHHGNELNPHINYPFLSLEKLKSFVVKARESNLRVKIYYTIRELTNYTAEIWALRSLGREVYTSEEKHLHATPVMGHPWLKEHLVTGYDPAWHQPIGRGIYDAAIRTAGLSRWHNYYIEGLSWLVTHAGIRGLYLDGIGYDREIMKRVRKVLDKAADDCLIDFHSGNSFSPEYGMTSPACMYLEHFPYIDSLWFGEGYDYKKSTPEYWLVEISGIPFGLFGEMLEGGGNPFRGMVYGMTSRLGWTRPNPRAIWRLWDKFGIKEAKMTGYWDPDCPVKTDRNDVLVTVYKKQETALLAIASWADEAVRCRIIIDWNKLGIEPTGATCFMPGIHNDQHPGKVSKDCVVTIPKARGLFIIVSAGSA
nr:DUF6067 family protein [Candidatus Sigynarchaeota archaeon]